MWATSILGVPLGQLVLYAFQVLMLLAVASFAFDCIHWTLHKMSHSRSGLLRAVASLHDIHHAFWDRELVFHDELLARNILFHHIPEFLTQLAVCSVFFLVLHPAPVLITMGILTFLFVNVVVGRGRDPNHKVLPIVPAPHVTVRINLPYHAMHHVFPDRYISSYFPFFDRLFGTGTQIAGRRFVMTGASGAFGAPLKEMLEKEGAASVVALKFGVDWSYDDYSKLEAVLKDADVLVLAHGAKRERTMEANCTSFVEFIERFKRVTQDRRFPVEVWAVGSEIEAHPHFNLEELKSYSISKRAYARHAWRYYREKGILYRHIVPSAFTSPMGPGLISGKTAARIAMFFIRRGARYVPVTYTGIALVNYFKFLFGIGKAAPVQGTAERVPSEPQAARAA